MVPLSARSARQGRTTPWRGLRNARNVHQGQQRMVKGTQNASTALQDTTLKKVPKFARPVNLENTRQQVERNLARLVKLAHTHLRPLQRSAIYAMRASTPLMERPSVRAAQKILIPSKARHGARSVP